MKRRSFLQLIGASTAAACTASTEPFDGDAQSLLTNSTDVLVIGAGPAGLVALRTLLDARIRAFAIDARGRIGGRAFTETDTFGVPFDHGCHWLHHSNMGNPWLAYAERRGFTLQNEPAPRYYVGARRATSGELAAHDAFYTRVADAMYDVGINGVDVPASTVIPDRSPWAATVEAEIAALSCGVDMDEISTVDWAVSDEIGQNKFSTAGYGAVIADYGRNLPVSLRTAAKAVRWGGARDVRVETTAGTIRAKAVICTVPVSLLARGDVRFDPLPPARQRDAFAQVDMASYDHVALRFRTNLGLPRDTTLIPRLSSRRGGYALMNVSGSKLCLFDTGGRTNEELRRGTDTAAVAFAVDELKKILGNSIERELETSAVTRWGTQPFTRGSWAMMKPGHGGKRATLSDPLGDRVFFAGEHTSVARWGTASGAFAEGRRAAREAISAVTGTGMTAASLASEASSFGGSRGRGRAFATSAQP